MGLVRSVFAVVTAVALSGCMSDDPTPPEPAPTTEASSHATSTMWLCGPDAETDACLAADLSTTAVEPDGSLRVEAHTVAKEPAVDCFYVYPTVNFEKKCGNVEDFTDVESERFATLNQAARFTGVCRLFAPLYRQAVRCSKLDREGWIARDAIADVAYQDVREAFEHYLTQHNAGRPYVLLGHSQGADLLARLVVDEIAPSSSRRHRMAAALLVGGDIFVPPGATTGGTLGDVPLCTREDETGCVVAYRTFAAERPPIADPSRPTPPGEMACTNPASLGGGKARLRASYFPNPSFWKHPIFDVSAIAARPLPPASTPYYLFEGLWTAECRKDDAGQSYLAIAAEPGPGDDRTDWIDYDNAVLSPASYGTHILDVQYALGDLMHLVAAKGAQMGRPASRR